MQGGPKVRQGDDTKARMRPEDTIFADKLVISIGTRLSVKPYNIIWGCYRRRQDKERHRGRMWRVESGKDFRFRLGGPPGTKLGGKEEKRQPTSGGRSQASGRRRDHHHHTQHEHR